MHRLTREARNPVVVITGASSGIGRATALRFADEGARLVLASRGIPDLDAVVADCIVRGAQAIGVPTDVARHTEVAALAEAAVAEFGGIDVWVNNAGISMFARFDEAPLDEFRRVLKVNIMGVVHGSREALRVMKSQGHGTIVNVASVLGEVPQPYTAVYGMSKAAVRALGVSIRQELALTGHRDIRLSTVLPPTIDTPFYDHAANHTGRALRAMPPVYPPEIVARAIVGASRKPKREVVVGRLGRIFVREHRVAPALAEVQMAGLVEVAQLSRTDEAPDTSGNLKEARGGGSSGGGWSGAMKMRRRMIVGGALAATGVVVLARRVLLMPR